MIIYLVLKLGKCVYVGQTTQSLAQRRGKHFSDARKGRGSVLGAAIRKHGEEKFGFVEYLSCNSLEELDSQEKKLIAEFLPRYNVLDGGQLSHSTWNKGRKETREEVRQNIRESARNRKMPKRGSYSPEHCAKIGLKTLERSKKSFICDQNGKVYSNKIEAANDLNVNPSSLSVLLSGKTRLKSLNGYTFRYIGAQGISPENSL